MKLIIYIHIFMISLTILIFWPMFTRMYLENYELLHEGDKKND